MRIALYHNLTSGGSKREAYEFCRYLVQRGHSIHAFCPSTADETFLPLKGVAERLFTFDLVLRPPVRSRLPGIRKYVDLTRLIINLACLRNLAQHIAERIDAGAYDFVFVHHDRVVQSPFLLRYLRTPSVYFCAEPMREYYEPAIIRPYNQPHTLIERIQRNWYAPADWIKTQMIKSLDRSNVQYASLLLTNSYFSAETIYRAYGLYARVVYLGVDPDLFRPLPIEKGNFVLSVGALSPLKGYDFLVRSLGRIPANQRPALLIACNTASAAEERYIQHIAREQGVQLQIRVNVSDQDLVELYNSALAFVYAPVLEPFGLAPLEAMACELPVVAVREGGVRESVLDGITGILTERREESFAAALMELLSNKTLRATMGKQAREHVLGFWTWEKAGERLLQAVADILP
jgi:glycosyltransferase involved in cell wall biosynthesis